MNGSLETVEGRPALRFERRLDHSPERVWRAITEPDELRRWFVASVDWKPEVGQSFEAMEQTGEIVEAERPRVFAYTWGGDLLRFELTPDGSGCVLVFTHVFDDRALGAQHATGWDLHLDRLGATLDGREVSDVELMEGFAELHERYAEHFGLDPEVGRRALAEHHGQN
jgi:uncharacterized protein YndB with AHSA1/START domain